MTISIIAAVGKNRELGKNNGLIWHLDGDLPFFKRVTMGKPVIMGRNTFLSLPKALPGRKNIVMTSRTDFEAPGAVTVSSVEAALEQAKGEEEVFIIGGASVYSQFIDKADRLYLTEAEAEDGSADVYFPEFDKREWKRTVIDEGGTDIKYVHALYERTGCGVTDVKELSVPSAETKGFIEASEKAYREQINAIVRALDERPSVKVILLAGPSSSGKTTTANILKDAILASGRDSDVISLDNFYRDHEDPDYPLLPDGSLDMECVDALVTDDIRKCIGDIIAGGSVSVPRYDFTTGKRKAESEEIFVEDNAAVIFEGLHALNPAVSDGFEPGSILKIYVSVATDVYDGDKLLLHGSDIRLARRISRDSIYRGYPAERTLGVWKSVTDGEKLYLDPFKNSADIRFDTFHPFEMGVLKKYFTAAVSGCEKTSCGLSALAEVFSRVDGIPAEAVPEDSLIMEFVPGGIYEALY